MTTYQSAFNDPISRAREVLERAQKTVLPEHEEYITNIAVSGGTDSVLTAEIMFREGPKYGFEPDAITHINTGAAVPQSRLVAKLMARKHGVEYIEQGPRNQHNALAPRILRNGWPGGYGGIPTQLGHGREWANRKNKPMNEVYMRWDCHEIWVSGSRKLESSRRSATVSDNAIDSDKPRRTWLSPIVGFTSEEKQRLITDWGLPVSEAYLVMGFSAECVGCAFDDKGLLTDLELIAPETAYALKFLAVWLGQLAVRGEVDIDAKQLCWGWTPGEDEEFDEAEETTTQEVIGCNAGSCATRNAPQWVMDLPPSQIVDRQDVLAAWDGNIDSIVARF